MKFESSQRSHIKESRRLITSAFLLSGSKVNSLPFSLPFLPYDMLTVTAGVRQSTIK